MTYRKFYIIVFSLLLTFFSLNIAFAATFSAAGIRLTKKVTPLNAMKREHVIAQSLDFSCGAAGLSTLLNFYLGDPVSEQEIIETLLMTVPIEKVRQRKGFSLFDLKTFAQQRGYDVTGYQMDVEFLKNLNVPVLVPIRFRNYSHFVVVRGVVGDRVFIADPAAGNMSMKIDQFERLWAGGIGLVVKNPQISDHEGYALKVDKEDFLVSDYKMLSKLMNQVVVRTAIFPSEY